jgi:uncharacterized protein (TIGR02996 family)
MTDEDAFLARLASVPADDTARLVYADWLEEQNTNEANRKAKFLRTQSALQREKDKTRKSALAQHLQDLAGHLQPSWLSVVSHLPIENCAAAGNAVRTRHPLTVRFEYQCPKGWTELKPTNDSGVRFCEHCKQDVHYCDTITTARQHVSQGHCIAVDVAIPRKPRDTNPPRLLGRVLPSSVRFQQIQERQRPDPVSEERERRKRKERRRRMDDE